MKFSSLWPRRWRISKPLSETQLNARRVALVKRIPSPTFWLLGKTGGGKSSVVRLLTGADAIQIGNGFRPTTRHTDLYLFPDPEMPIMKFLDTRGLGEPGYCPQEDIAAFKEMAHAVIITHRLLDFASQSLVAPLQHIRNSAPNRPVLLALTCLHQAYPQRQHPPYPFKDSLTPPGLDESVARAIAAQRSVFEGLVDAIVPIDLTLVEAGFKLPDYGSRHLTNTLTGLLPAAYQTSLRSMAELLHDLKDLHERAAMPYVQSTAVLAAAAAISPVPWVDIPVVAGLQTRMIYLIARIYRQSGTVNQLLEMLAGAGLGFAARMGVRELAKLVPYAGTMIGGVLGAALGYSYTFALGKACCWYHSSVLAGHEPTKSEIEEVFQRNWQEGKARWKSMQFKLSSR